MPARGELRPQAFCWRQAVMVVPELPADTQACDQVVVSITLEPMQAVYRVVILDKDYGLRAGNKARALYDSLINILVAVEDFPVRIYFYCDMEHSRAPRAAIVEEVQPYTTEAARHFKQLDVFLP